MDRELPTRVTTLLRGFQPRSISIGFNGIYLSDDPIAETRAFDFCIRDPKWLVIGTAGGCGDPVVADVTDPKYPVFSIAHDMIDDPVLGSDAEPVADSLELFLSMMSSLATKLSARNGTTSYEDAPMDADEINRFLAEYQRKNPRSGDRSFWRRLLERE